MSRNPTDRIVELEQELAELRRIQDLFDLFDERGDVREGDGEKASPSINAGSAQAISEIAGSQPLIIGDNAQLGDVRVDPGGVLHVGSYAQFGDIRVDPGGVLHVGSYAQFGAVQAQSIEQAQIDLTAALAQIHTRQEQATSEVQRGDWQAAALLLETAQRAEERYQRKLSGVAEDLERYAEGDAELTDLVGQLRAPYATATFGPLVQPGISAPEQQAMLSLLASYFSFRAALQKDEIRSLLLLTAMHNLNTLREAYATPSYEFVRAPLLASTVVLLQPFIRENPELQTVLDLLQR